MESWLEVNLVTTRAQDEELLTDVVGRLVHGELAGAIETWFFFWEPELRLRLRWADPDRAGEHRAVVAASLDELQAAGSIVEWYEGAHGRRGERYEGESELYGPETWPRVQKDWMNGSELAVLLTSLEQAGTLTRPRDFHWQRHVHLTTNQLYGTWIAEIELCLAQALGYLRHLQAAGETASDEARGLIDELTALAGRRDS